MDEKRRLAVAWEAGIAICRVGRLPTGDDIHLRFKDRVVRDMGRWFIYSPEVAIELVDVARGEGVRALGADGFLLHPNDGVQPDQGHDEDWESEADPWSAATEYLEPFIGTSWYFEISLDR